MHSARTLPLSALLFLGAACATFACSTATPSGSGSPPRDEGRSAHALTVTPDGQPAFPIAGVGGTAGAGASTRLLLMRAGVECGVGVAAAIENERLTFAPKLEGTLLNFGASGAVYPLVRAGQPAVPKTCDERMAHAEALVCMAVLAA